MASRFERFSDGSRKALSYSQEEAQRLNHSHMEPGHILLSLVREQEDIDGIHNILRELGVNPKVIRNKTEERIGRYKPDTYNIDSRLGPINVGLTKSAKRVIEGAVAYARKVNSMSILGSYILYGLTTATAKENSTAYDVLTELGISEDLVDRQITGV